MDHLEMLDVQVAMELLDRLERLDQWAHQDHQETLETTAHQDSQETSCREPMLQPADQDQTARLEIQDDQAPMDSVAKTETTELQGRQARVDSQDQTVGQDSQDNREPQEPTEAREAATLALPHVWHRDTSQSIDIILVICTVYD